MLASGDSTADGLIVSPVWCLFHFPKAVALSAPNAIALFFSIATAFLGSPPPVETWDWALPGASADRGREETVGQRRHHTAHPAAPHQGEMVRPLAPSPPLFLQLAARESHL